MLTREPDFKGVAKGMMENQMQAPASANQMRRWMRNTKALAYVFGALALAALVLLVVARRSPHKQGLTAIGIIASVSFTAGVFVCVLTYFNCRTLARQTDELLLGQTLLARWSLTPAEWSLFAVHESARARKLMGRISLFILAPLVVLLFWPFLRGGLHGSAFVLLLPLGVLIFIALLLWLVLFAPVRQLRRGAGDVCVSRDGVLMCGNFTSWHMMGGRLTGVRYVEGEPAAVEFSWTQPGAGARGSSAPRSLRVPVARGHEDEARRLVASFNS